MRTACLRPALAGRPAAWAALATVAAMAVPAGALAGPGVVRPGMDCARADAFAAHSWQPPPPPPPAPPPPAAPPLPFRFLGEMREGSDAPTAFLSWQNRIVAVRAGLVIDGRYRVEAIEAGRILFTYLPLQQRQALPTGTAP